MKKLSVIIIVLFFGYVTAYFFVGKSKNYEFIPNASSFEFEDMFKNFSNFIEDIGKVKVSTEDSLAAVNYFNEGLNYYKEGKIEDASWSFEDATMKNPYFKEALFWNAKIKFELKDYYYSSELFEKLLELDENYDSVFFYLGKNDYFQEYYSKASDNFKIYLEQDTQSLESYDYLAWSIYHDMYNPEAAIQIAEKAIKIDKDYFPIRFSLGYFYIKLAESAEYEQTKIDYYKKSITHNKYCLKLNKNYQEAAYNTFLAYNKINMQDSAIYYAKQTVKINPEYSNAYGGLAELYYNKKDYKKSIYYANQAINLADSIEYFHYYKALSNYQLNNYTDAIEGLKKCYSISLKASYFLNIAEIYSLIDSTDKAINYYSEYINNGYLSEQEKDSILKIIENLDKFN